MRRRIAVLLCGAISAAAPGQGAYGAVGRVLMASGGGTSSPYGSVGRVLTASGVGATGAPASAVPALHLPSVSLPPATAAMPSAGTPAAVAIPIAAQAEASIQDVLKESESAPEDLQLAGARIFDAAASNESSAPAVPEGGIAGPAPGLRPAARRPSRVGAAVSVLMPLIRGAAKDVRESRRSRLTLSVGLSVLLAAASPWIGAGALAAPLILGTCSSMRERVVKNSVILPQEENAPRKELAKKELDQVLVNFGKRLKAAASADVRVAASVTAHDAEHAMEEPILDRLPAWKALWAEGNGPSKEEALRELRAAILKRLGAALPGEAPAILDELLNKTGSWEELLDWEKRYDILDSLRTAAEGGKRRENVRSGGGTASGSNGSMLGMLVLGGIGLSLAALWSGGFAFPALLTIGMVGFGVLGDSEAPAPPPVPLDSYLAGLGLSAEDAEFLAEYTIDLGARDLAPIIGRSKELQRVITILSKPAGMQNNPMILGDKGVGKTAVVEAVAKYLHQNLLPSLRDKRILELDTGKLAAGTGVVGEMEKRLTRLRSILAKTGNKVIIFVDEIHSILKNTATSNSVPDLLKSPLRNGEITVIGATTMGEYRKYLETDPAFADRFDPVLVSEPAVDEAVEMLEGDLEYLERKFGVEIDPEAAQAAVKLSARYIPEKFLPRKARVLLESAVAEAKPAAARDGARVQIDQLADRLRIFVKRYAALKSRGDPEKKSEEVQTRNRIVSLYSAILALEEKRSTLAAEKIGKDHVMRTLAKETGIQLGDLGEDEYKRLLDMEPWFKKRIVGQDEAVQAVADAVRTNKAGFSDPNRPQGVFLFAGKTGVGKTALARTLAEFLFSNPEAVIRLDMSEYMERFAVQRLFGAPPGYVGYDSGGELTEKVRRQPYSVVLFDEIEKAHPDVLNALLQIFDAGRMTDGRQNTVNFKNTIIIMTSNLGSGSASEGDRFKADVLDAVRERLRPELVNRIDKVIVFNPLTIEQAKPIVRIMLDDVGRRLREQSLELHVEPGAVDHLARKGFDPAYGARPLKRAVENDVTGPMSRFLLGKKAEGALANGGVVVVAEKGGEIAFELRPNPLPSVEPSPLPPGPLGEKLRRILEDAARGSDSTKDMKTFESVLFPERRAAPPEAEWGAFRSNQAPAEGPATRGASFSKPIGRTPGLKDPDLESVKAEIAGKLGGRWPSPAAAEAVEAWLDAFSRLAKEMTTSGQPSLQYSIPRAEDPGEAEFSFLFQGDAGDAAVQRFALLAQDHFAAPVADEDAVRARAAALKDGGRAADRALLDVKRLVESAAGATFGFSTGQDLGGVWKFWLRAPVKASPAAAPQPAAPVTPLDARLSAAKMFLFLTQRAPAAMQGERLLVADMLDSKSSQVRLLGLHMASAILAPEAFLELTAAGRTIRLADAKDHAVFADLAAENPGVAMAAQRRALADRYVSKLADFDDLARNGRYGAQSYDRDADLYADLAAEAAPALDSEASKAALARSDRIRLRFAKAAWSFGLLGALVAAAAAGAWVLHAPLWASLAGGITGLIAVLVAFKSYFDGARSRARLDSTVFETLLLRRLAPAEQAKVAARWLKRASRGSRPWGDASKTAEILPTVMGQMPEAARNRIFRAWRTALEKALARRKARNAASDKDATMFTTLGLLARVGSWAPAEDRDALARVLLAPLKERWLPFNPQDYLAGLGTWLARAALSPAEAEDLFSALFDFPMDSRYAMNFVSVYEALAGQASLTPELRSALDQHLAEMVAGTTDGNRNARMLTVALELTRLRARLGYERQAWAALREILGPSLADPDGWEEPTFRALDRFLLEAPPTVLEKAWLEPALRRALYSRKSTGVHAALPFSRVAGSDEERLGAVVATERLGAVLTALRDAPLTAETSYNPPVYKDLLARLRALAAGPLAADKALADEWASAVKENLARLGSSDR